MKKYFTQKLLQWYRPDIRKMPWKGIKNPYIIWLSEIILQQTRVEQGLPYFNRFLKKYPSVFDLAKADENEVMKMWEGLGYYSRARNLLITAKAITEQFNGEFPNEFAELKKLKGIGDYTAAAISSFAFNQPHAVVDGNVFRVLSRFFGITTPVDSTEGKKYFTRLANQLIDKKNPSRYNQAIMDFGAVQCVPSNPDCNICPLKNKCIAFREKKVDIFPLKSKKIKQKIRYFNYLVIENKNSFLLQQRTERDIWKKLYEFPLIESEKEISEKELKKNKTWKLFYNTKKPVSAKYIQQLTHQKILATFWELKSNAEIDFSNNNFFSVNKKLLTTFAFPKIIFCYLKDKNYI